MAGRIDSELISNLCFTMSGESCVGGKLLIFRVGSSLN